MATNKKANTYVSNSKQNRIRQVKGDPSNFMAIEPLLDPSVTYPGSTGSTTLAPPDKSPGPAPSADPDYVPPVKIDPIISEVLIGVGTGAIIDPRIKVTTDSPVIRLGGAAPIETPIDTVPGTTDQTLTPTVNDKGKKLFVWIAAIVVVVAAIYLIRKK